jgi:hypothetical protein
VELRFDGVDEMVAALYVKADALDASAKDVAKKLAMAFIGEAKRNATGPARIAGKVRRTRARKGQPSRVLASWEGGPGVVTGFLRNSIQVRDERATATGYEVTVHPSGPYYRRLELGFRGTDSIGRRYNQRAYPFMRPAAYTVRARANQIARRAWADALHAA